MDLDNVKRTAPLKPSVGADEGRPSTKTTNSLPQKPTMSKNEFSKEAGLGGPASLPDEVKQHGKFCCWRYEERKGKQTKVPYNPRTGERAMSNDPQTFGTFDEAIKAKGFTGIGIGIFGGVCAIDIDHCIEDGKLSDNAREIVRLMHSYTEVSPSGTGVHILFWADGFAYDKDTYYIMNAGSGIEVYVSGATNKYVTITGHRCTDDDFGERSAELQKVLERFMRRDPAPAYIETVV